MTNDPKHLPPRDCPLQSAPPFLARWWDSARDCTRNVVLNNGTDQPALTALLYLENGPWEDLGNRITISEDTEDLREAIHAELVKLVRVREWLKDRAETHGEQATDGNRFAVGFLDALAELEELL